MENVRHSVVVVVVVVVFCIQYLSMKNCNNKYQLISILGKARSDWSIIHLQQ